MNKKIIIGIIIGGIIFGSVGVYAGTKFYANDVSVNVPTGSNLGSNASLQNSLDELYSIADKYDELKSEISSMIDKIYPVGSIYISTSIASTSDVAKKFGGTWESYGSGRTIIGAGTGVDSNNLSKNFKVNETGGEYTHTLSINEMPSHTHIQNPHSHSIGFDLGYNNYIGLNSGSVEPDISIYFSNPVKGGRSYTMIAHSQTATNKYTGGDKSHNNIQPYITVYMYKRIK